MVTDNIMQVGLMEIVLASFSKGSCIDVVKPLKVILLCSKRENFPLEKSEQNVLLV